VNNTAPFCNVQHKFSDHSVTGKICGLTLADSADFYMILLLRKHCLQTGIMVVVVLYGKQTWHFDRWRRWPRQCHLYSWNSRCTRTLEIHYCQQDFMAI